MTKKKKIASTGKKQRNSVPSGGETNKKPPLVIEFVFKQPPKPSEHGTSVDQGGAEVAPDPPKRVVFDFHE